MSEFNKEEIDYEDQLRQSVERGVAPEKPPTPCTICPYMNLSGRT